MCCISTWCYGNNMAFHRSHSTMLPQPDATIPEVKSSDASILWIHAQLSQEATKNGESDFETDLHSIALEELCANKKGKGMLETVRRAIEPFEQRGQRRAIDQEGMSRLKLSQANSAVRSAKFQLRFKCISATVGMISQLCLQRTTISVDILLQCELLQMYQIYYAFDLVGSFATLFGFHHLPKHGLQLVRQPRNDWTTASSSLVLRMSQNVFLGKAPVPPAEVTNLIQSAQVMKCRRLVLKTKLFDADRLCRLVYPFQELPMIPWTICAEVAEDFGERCVGHSNLQK